MTEYWKPGDNVVLREIWRGRVWAGRPVTVVEDTDSRLIVYFGSGVRWMRPARPDGTLLRTREEGWVLKEGIWPIEVLRIVTPGSHHSTLLQWTEGFRGFRQWYVNLEDPLTRSPIGFDFLDQILDIEVAPDLSKWNWKDEDELEESIMTGVLTAEKADVIRSEGERVIAALGAGDPPFDEPWDKWRPNPNWTRPSFPEGWLDLHKYPASGGEY